MSALAAAFEALLGALDRLEIQFLVGGSVASGIHGVPRMTNDIDIVADLQPELAEEFCRVLNPVFYADPTQAKAAIGAGRAFNAIHRESGIKFDIFPVGADRFVHSELSRRCYTSVAIPGLEDIEFPVASPEDMILAKLVWFRKGGEVSDRQWHDILSIVHVQADRLDVQYLQNWAVELGVADLLARARASGATFTGLL